MAKEKSLDTDAEKEKLLSDEEQQKIREQLTEYFREKNIFIADFHNESMKARKKNVYSYEQLSGPPPEVDPNDPEFDGVFVYAADTPEGFLPPFNSTWKVFEGEGKNKKEKPYQIHINEKGEARPVFNDKDKNMYGSEAWEATIDMYIQKYRYSTMVLKVNPNPYNRVDAANQLLNWAQICISRGVAAKLDPDTAQKFFDSIGPNDPLAGTKALIQEAIQMSQFKLAGSQIMAASHPTKSWLTYDADKIESKAATSNAEIERLEDLDNEEQKITGLLKELETSFKQLSATEKRLVDIKEGEEAILQNPEVLVKGDNVSRPEMTMYSADRDKTDINPDLQRLKIDKKGIRFEAQPKQEYATNFKKLMDLPLKEKTVTDKLDDLGSFNKDTVVANKLRVANVCETERARLQNLKTRVDMLIDGSALANKNDLKKDLAKYDSLNANGDMQTKIKKVKDWYTRVDDATPSPLKTSIDDAKKQVQNQFAKGGYKP